MSESIERLLPSVLSASQWLFQVSLPEMLQRTNAGVVKQIGDVVQLDWGADSQLLGHLSDGRLVRLELLVSTFFPEGEVLDVEATTRALSRLDEEFAEAASACMRMLGVPNYIGRSDEPAAPYEFDVESIVMGVWELDGIVITVLGTEGEGPPGPWDGRIVRGSPVLGQTRAPGDTLGLDGLPVAGSKRGRVASRFWCEVRRR
jgi:hypothetical protein